MAFYGDSAALSTTAASVWALLGSPANVEYCQQLDIRNSAASAITIYAGDSTVASNGDNAAIRLAQNEAWTGLAHDGRTVNLKGIYVVAASGTPTVNIAVIV